MSSLDGVSSGLIARNESWVRKEASALARRLPSNVEKADLIQVGLIAVAHAALVFDWEGDPESAEGKAAFIGFARLRVRGAMLDELRQMDHLQRDDRRKVKALQIARDRWTTLNGTTATLAELSSFSSTGVDEIARLDALPASLQSDHLDGDVGDHYRPTEAVTEEDEIEARVDTEIVLRRLEKYFATLPVRDREVIDAYLGIGLTPTALAHALDITPSRVSQLFKDVCTRVARHFGNDMKDVGADRRRVSGAIFEQQIAAREARAAASNDVHWGVLIEQALTGQRAKDNATGRHRAG